MLQRKSQQQDDHHYWTAQQDDRSREGNKQICSFYSLRVLRERSRLSQKRDIGSHKGEKPTHGRKLNSHKRRKKPHKRVKNKLKTHKKEIQWKASSKKRDLLKIQMKNWRRSRLERRDQKIEEFQKEAAQIKFQKEAT